MDLSPLEAEVNIDPILVETVLEIDVKDLLPLCNREDTLVDRLLKLLDREAEVFANRLLSPALAVLPTEEMLLLPLASRSVILEDTPLKAVTILFVPVERAGPAFAAN